MTLSEIRGLRLARLKLALLFLLFYGGAEYLGQMKQVIVLIRKTESTLTRELSQPNEELTKSVKRVDELIKRNRDFSIYHFERN